MTSSFTVQGMTCQHCVNAVTEEVGEIPGVTAVAVDLPTGHVTFESADPVAESAIRAAVQEAGYELAAG